MMGTARAVRERFSFRYCWILRVIIKEEREPMKSTQFSILTVSVILSLFSLNAFAQNYTQFSLPEGVKARLGKGSVRGVAYSPDGTRFAVPSSIGIWLYDTATHQEVALLTGHTDIVSSVSFSPDGSTVASGSWDDTVRLWDAVTGEEQKTLTGHTDSVNSVSFSPDGSTVASGSSDRTVRLWDAVTGGEQATLTGHTNWVTSVVFSPDGGTVASGSGDDTVAVMGRCYGRGAKDSYRAYEFGQ